MWRLNCLGEHRMTHALTLATGLSLAVFMATAAVPQTATQLLTKGSGKYVGHIKETDRTVFATCHGGELQIAPGKVTSAASRCSEPGIDPVVGPIKSIDVAAATFTLEDVDHNDIAFTLKGEERALVLQIKVGTKLRVDMSQGQRRFMMTK
jgi:hypothetical protein